MSKSKFNSKTIATMAILTALSMVLYMSIKFPLPFIFPSFLEIQFSDAPIIIGSYMFGLSGGMILTLARFLLKIPFTATAMVGELADLIITLSFIIPSTIIYKKIKRKGNLTLSLMGGSISATVFAMIANQILLIPFYVEFYFGGDFSALVNMVKPLYSAVTKENFYIFYQFLAVLPFNILRLTICSVVIYPLFKRLSKTIFIEN